MPKDKVNLIKKVSVKHSATANINVAIGTSDDKFRQHVDNRFNDISSKLDEFKRLLLRCGISDLTTEQNKIENLCHEGLNLCYKQRYEEAFYKWKQASDLGSSIAKYYIGWCYENGYGVEHDLQNAENYYAVAADLGITVAQEAVKNVKLIQKEAGESKYLSNQIGKEGSEVQQQKLELTRHQYNTVTAKCDSNNISRRDKVTVSKKRITLIKLSGFVLASVLIIGQILQYYLFYKNKEIAILSAIFYLYNEKQHSLWFLLISSTLINITSAIGCIFIILRCKRSSCRIFYPVTLALLVISSSCLILIPCFAALLLFALVVLGLIVLVILNKAHVISMEKMFDDFFEKAVK